MVVAMRNLFYPHLKGVQKGVELLIIKRFIWVKALWIIKTDRQIDRKQTDKQIDRQIGRQKDI